MPKHVEVLVRIDTKNLRNVWTAVEAFDTPPKTEDVVPWRKMDVTGDPGERYLIVRVPVTGDRT